MTTQPFRLNGLDGYSSDQGPTFDAGWFVGSIEIRGERSVTVRLSTPMGRPATVELDLTRKEHHGCTTTLTPDAARQIAAALVERADAAEAEMARWREVVERQKAELKEAYLQQARGSAGLAEEPA